MSWKDTTDIRVVTGAHGQTAVAWMIEDRTTHDVLGLAETAIVWGASLDGVRFARKRDASAMLTYLGLEPRAKVAEYVFSD